MKIERRIMLAEKLIFGAARLLGLEVVRLQLRADSQESSVLPQLEYEGPLNVWYLKALSGAILEDTDHG